MWRLQGLLTPHIRGTPVPSAQDVRVVPRCLHQTRGVQPASQSPALLQAFPMLITSLPVPMWLPGKQGWLKQAGVPSCAAQGPPSRGGPEEIRLGDVGADTAGLNGAPAPAPRSALLGDRSISGLVRLWVGLGREEQDSLPPPCGALRENLTLCRVSLTLGVRSRQRAGVDSLSHSQGLKKGYYSHHPPCPCKPNPAARPPVHTSSSLKSWPSLSPATAHRIPRRHRSHPIGHNTDSTYQGSYRIFIYK